MPGHLYLNSLLMFTPCISTLITETKCEIKVCFLSGFTSRNKVMANEILKQVFIKYIH